MSAVVPTFEQFTSLVADVRAGRATGTEHDGQIETTIDGVAVTLVPDASTGPLMIKGGETIRIDERTAFRAEGEIWEEYR